MQHSLATDRCERPLSHNLLTTSSREASSSASASLSRVTTTSILNASSLSLMVSSSRTAGADLLDVAVVGLERPRPETAPVRSYKFTSLAHYKVIL